MIRRRRKKKGGAGGVARSMSCPECRRRFVPVRSGGGVAREQVCPFCFERVEKPDTVPSLKAETWKVFAVLVKLSHRDSAGFCMCVTCGVQLQWDDRNMHAGHFLQSRSKGILFEKVGVNPQCHRCNVILHGNTDEYWPWMLRTHGQAEIDRLLDAKWRGGNWTLDELRALHSDFSAQVADILSRS